jgi:AraC-like DNA-binding protein
VVKPEHANFFQQLRPGQFLERLFDAIPGVHLFVKERGGHFVSASAGFVRIMGAESLEDLLGKTDYDFSADFLAEGFVADDRRVMETGEPLLDKVEMVPQGESLDWVFTSKIPLYARDGSIIGLAGVLRRTQAGDALYGQHPEMQEIVQFVRKNFRERVGVKDFARVGGISVSSVERRFRKIFDMSPAKYLKRTRLNAACRLLRTTDDPVTRVSELCGFNDPTAMSRDFRTQLRMSPREYRSRYKEREESVA